MGSEQDNPAKSGEKRTAASRHGGARSAQDASRGDTGAALRGIYQNTIDEQVPDDLLSLLRQLD